VLLVSVSRWDSSHPSAGGLPPWVWMRLNRCHVGKQALAGMSYGTHQQPWNGVSIQGIHVGYCFARDLAAVFQFPCRTGEMASDNLTLSVCQLCIGRLERPGELSVRAGLAGIDLRSRGMRGEDNFFGRRSLDCIRHVGRRLCLCVSHSEPEQRRECDESANRRRSPKSSHSVDCSRAV